MQQKARQRKISWQVDNITLVGKLYIPPGTNKHPAVCISHGIPAVPYNAGDSGYSLLAQRFSDAGFTTLIFNFRGTGESQGDLDMAGWAHDLQGAINYLYQQKTTKISSLCLLGFSAGAAISVYVAAHDARISSVVSCACPAEFTTLVNKKNALGAIQHFRDIGAIRNKDFPSSILGWIKGFESVKPIGCIDKVSPRPLLLIHGDADEIIPVGDAHRLYHRALKPKDLAIIQGAQHKLRLEEAAIATIFAWIAARPELALH